MTDARFDLDPAVHHLNPGSVGVVPRAVRQARAGFAQRAETNPMRFHRVEAIPLVARARAAGAEFLGSDGLVLVRNVTEAVATALASIPFADGDEILVSDHGYQAVLIACQDRARVRQVSFPVDATADEVVAAFAEGLRPTTRLVVVDAITSITALVLPVERVVALAHEHGVPVFVDAAHVPGHLDQRPADTGADFWVGNFHKWAYVPRATAGLHIAEPWRDRIRPLVPSFNHPLRFPDWFDHAGTADYTAWMALPDGLAFWHEIGGWDAVAASARLLDKGVRIVADAVGADGQASPHHAPLMRLVALPPGLVTSAEDAYRYYDELSTQHRIETAVHYYGGRGYLRLGATITVTEAGFAALADAVSAGR
ncbi:isopenicillin-N epimerase [Actinokineospora baliensis]|uniref:aminotransferase class V-fold PLP-dependent enzyme n=1 Tax=Actinokineospora baliensis TaxID=547056 RepID=UPI00195C7168|nr:aminotransferase class V-fold PLP-dependent enzyme [Actinokineospora baliensis]MBM7775119.1 isopenicillin-N epimerase [Actinokineospora baliensis]